MISKISVIICTRNRFDNFKGTVTSLTKQARLPDELIVVDSSDVLQIEGYLETTKLPFPIQYFHTRPGLTLQRNHGICQSKGDLLFFFDDDVDLDSSYLSEVEKVFVSDTIHEIGAVGGRVVSPHGDQPKTILFWLGPKIFGLIRSFFGLVGNGSGRFRWSGMPTHPFASQPSQYIECLSGCCMAFRREVFEKVAFDESLTRYALMEDADISKQTLDAGYKIYYQASAQLIHNTSPTNRLKRQPWAEMTVVNYDYLFRKNWSKDPWRWLFYYWAMVGLVVSNLHNLGALKGSFNGIIKVLDK
ncbi:MAG: glycosyltransferase [Chloroflexota bacterium]